jgi:hypothetical protein
MAAGLAISPTTTVTHARSPEGRGLDAAASDSMIGARGVF